MRSFAWKCRRGLDFGGGPRNGRWRVPQHPPHVGSTGISCDLLNAAGRTERPRLFFSGAGGMVRHKKRRCATSRHTCSQTRACRRPGRATAAQPRQVTSPWRDGPRWSAINGQPPRAWMSMPLRGRMWYFDYVHYTGAARTFWALRWRQVWRVWRVGRCAGDATLCCALASRCPSMYCMRVCTRSAPAFRASHAF